MNVHSVAFNNIIFVHYFIMCVRQLFQLSAITVRFGQTTYSVDEDDGQAQPTLVLSNPSSTAFTVQIRDTEVTATSGQTNIMILMFIQSYRK